LNIRSYNHSGHDVSIRGPLRDVFGKNGRLSIFPLLYALKIDNVQRRIHLVLCGNGRE
jgi:hypothetical protein